MSATVNHTTSTKPRRRSAPWIIMAGKEIRENFKWAILGLITAALTLIYAVNIAEPERETHELVIRYWGNVNKALAGAAPLLAILLGLLQTVPERRRDLWAFLIHRPASRSSLFLGKIVAGLGLYFTALVIPFLGVILWAAAPGNIPAPFVWELTFAGWAAILAGVPLYFATMLTVLRPGRWYGRKMLPICAALPILMLLAVGSPLSFTASAGIMALCATVFASAAHKAFQTDGDFHGASLGRFSLGTILLAGSTIVLLLVTFLGTVLEGNINRDARQAYYSYQYYGLRQSGEIIRVAYQNGNTSIAGIRTPDGRPENRPLTEKETADGYYMPDTFFNNTVSTIQNAGFTTPQQIIWQTRDMISPELLWYYVPSLRRFVGYSSITRRFDMAIGPNGLASIHEYTPVSDPGRFPDVSWNVAANSDNGTILCTEGAAYQIGADMNPSRRIPFPPGTGKITAVTDLTTTSIMDRTTSSPDIAAPSSGSEPVVAITTARSFILLARAGYVIASIPREFDEASYPTAYVIWPQYGDSGQQASHARHIYIWYRSEKDIQVRAWSIGGDKIASYSMPVIKYPQQLHTFPYWTVVPYAFHAGAWIWDIWQNSHSTALKNSPPLYLGTRERLGYIFIAGICLLLSWLIGYRCRLPIRTQVAWAMAAISLGIPALMTMLALYDWPALVRCPNCGHKRSVDLELCGHCKSPFPAPSRDGTEIFDGVNSRVSGPSTSTPGIDGKREVAA